MKCDCINNKIFIAGSDPRRSLVRDQEDFLTRVGVCGDIIIRSRGMNTLAQPGISTHDVARLPVVCHR